MSTKIVTQLPQSVTISIVKRFKCLNNNKKAGEKTPAKTFDNWTVNSLFLFEYLMMMMMVMPNNFRFRLT